MQKCKDDEMKINQLDVLRQTADIEPNAITELEWVILLAETVSVETRRKAAAELAALQARVELLKGLLNRAEGFVGYMADAIDADDEEIGLHKEITAALDTQA